MRHHVELNEVVITREEQQEVEYPKNITITLLVNIYITIKLSSETALWAMELAKSTISIPNMKSFVLHKIK